MTRAAREASEYDAEFERAERIAEACPRREALISELSGCDGGDAWGRTTSRGRSTRVLRFWWELLRSSEREVGPDLSRGTIRASDAVGI